MASNDRAFSFLNINRRAEKPRTRGLTEIRGPYYTPLGRHSLEDVLQTMGAYIDILKFAGGSFVLFPRRVLTEFIEACHEYQVEVSTGGFIEYVLTQGPQAVDRYLGECADLGFDLVEVSSGFVTLPAEDLVQLARRVQKAGLKVKPEVGIQFGAGGASSAESLKAEGVRDVGWTIRLTRQYLEAGANLIMVESEGITENVQTWRLEVIARLVDEFGLDHLLFEAADPEVFGWYVKTYGPEVNLFVDHSQIVQLECLRSGIWGTKDLWGRIRTYKPD